MVEHVSVEAIVDKIADEIKRRTIHIKMMSGIGMTSFLLFPLKWMKPPVKLVNLLYEIGERFVDLVIFEAKA